jgi:hypothetical protein
VSTETSRQLSVGRTSCKTFGERGGEGADWVELRGFEPLARRLVVALQPSAERAAQRSGRARSRSGLVRDASGHHARASESTRIYVLPIDLRLARFCGDKDPPTLATRRVALHWPWPRRLSPAVGGSRLLRAVDRADFPQQGKAGFARSCSRSAPLSPGRLLSCPNDPKRRPTSPVASGPRRGRIRHGTCEAVAGTLDAGANVCPSFAEAPRTPWSAP